MENNLFKSKFFRTAAIMSILVLIITLILTPHKSSTSLQTSPTPDSITQLRANLKNLGAEKVENAADYYDLVSDSFPFYYPNFHSSVGISTEIHIFHFEDDPLGVTRFEINGLSYINKNEIDESKNPNITAFKESFIQGLALLTEAGIDPNKLIFIYSDKDYIQSSASYWVEKLGLLR